MSNPKTATYLKNEGNALYVRGDYERAYPAMIVLAKFPCSTSSWKRAVATLNKDNLTLRQREDYESWLSSTRSEWDKIIAKKKIVLSSLSVSKGGFPWDRALALQPDLARLGSEKHASSAWVISGASHEFREGVRIMRLLPKVAAEGPAEYMAMPNALDCLVSGILRDDRVFYIDDSSWLAEFNQLVTFETEMYQARSSELSAVVMEEAYKRWRKSGWDAVRPSLAKTVRLWIIRGFVEGMMHQDHSLATEFIGRALDTLDWGRRTWPDVSEADKGVVFSHTFTRGVRSLYLESLMKAFVDHYGEYSAESLTVLYETAEEILRDLEIHPLVRDNIKDYDRGFESSFTVYPRGRALHAKAFYYRQLASVLENATMQQREGHRLQAAKIYLEAADCYPVDDENHVWMLKCAVEDLRLCGLQHGQIAGILKRIKSAIPKMKRIWEYSTLALNGRNSAIGQVLDMERSA
ncbi:hypothetical protein GLOTRDRAFT_131993 [Gloeophyllum trabeum ATCC 11539]|uniref:Uncharacterized protein n=1 Tax=Gloeophyllum trabeum (strain ATCC 11539 / FP-39264 / Madison 617) TaxID=670483 RepID=S7PYM5_GLOTA|nr:uncharacterized protein GLOTRDRAFT_131993 [Gloeophyllum trabeum ATCC 11539]EPQ52756.1 hypothetical protein GLOTRDRAFT_131993 [Gloeophyllum trabeum ATCC 11539]